MQRTINFPADIGDTVYFLDRETNLIYPMLVHNITKNRLGDFKLILVSTDSSWDNQYAEIVNLEDYNRLWFTNLNEAETKHQSNISFNTLISGLYKTSQLFDSLKYKTIALKDTGITVKIKEYDYFNQAVILFDNTNTIYIIPINELNNKLTLT